MFGNGRNHEAATEPWTIVLYRLVSEGLSRLVRIVTKYATLMQLIRHSA